MTLRQSLKHGTSDLHEELDGLLGRFNLADDGQYRDFLMIHARVLPPIEEALDGAGIADLLADWADHRRTPLLQRDLKALGEGMPQGVSPPALQGTAAVLGTAYVIEGSRLGSRFLARRVGSAMPAEYLNAAGQQTAWPALLDALDAADFKAVETRRAIEAARACFGVFLSAVDPALADG